MERLLQNCFFFFPRADCATHIWFYNPNSASGAQLRPLTSVLARLVGCCFFCFFSLLTSVVLVFMWSEKLHVVRSFERTSWRPVHPGFKSVARCVGWRLLIISTYRHPEGVTLWWGSKLRGTVCQKRERRLSAASEYQVFAINDRIFFFFNFV